MNRNDLIVLARTCRWAVQASHAPAGAPQAAVIGVVVGDTFEVFFDTLGTSRKAHNLRRDPRCALVIGWDQHWTIQLEGLADEPTGAELERLLPTYLSAFPDGVERQAWPNIAYFRVRPSWVRFSDYRGQTPVIVEFNATELGPPQQP